MATRPRRRERVVHQRDPDSELAGGYLHRERAKHERRATPGADVPQPQRPDQAAPMHRREGEAFGGRASVAQALAGAHMAVLAKAGIEQRFTGDDVRGLLRTDRERSGLRGEDSPGLAQGSHGTSVPAANGARRAAGSVVKIGNVREGAGGPAPD
jgi:hypothetical protein